MTATIEIPLGSLKGQDESFMDSFEDDDQLLAAKVAFALRLVRTALGLNQAEFGELMEVSKPTIVRIETLESPVKLAFYSKMVKRLAERGIHVDAITPEGVTIEADQSAVERLIQQVGQEKQRRSDGLKRLAAGELSKNRKVGSKRTSKSTSQNRNVLEVPRSDSGANE